MRQSSLCLALLLALCPAAAAQDGKQVLETWQAAYFEGLKVGHSHTVVREIKAGNAVQYRTARGMHLVIKRYGSIVPIHVDQTCDETESGKVLAMSATHFLAKDDKQ